MTVALTAVDAQAYWMSAKIPNDQFLLYALDGEPAYLKDAVAQVIRRARRCPDLALRVDDRCALRYPAWERRDVTHDQVVVHGPAVGWQQCLDAVAALADHQLDLRDVAWRLHVFSPVPGVPGTAVPSTVTVVQMGHALGDGVRSSALAAVLFGRAAQVPGIRCRRRGCVITRGVAAARAHRRLERDTAAGLVPPPAPPRPALSINSRPDGRRAIRTFARRRSKLPVGTVTVAVLAAVSDALSAYLRDHGEDASTLGAEVPMAKNLVRQANNHFGNVGVGLYPELPSDERVERISAELHERRRRTEHPAFEAGDRSLAAVPAPLLRWGVRKFDADARSPVVIGNTVVSSVDRGPADLTFGGRPVVLASGYPALSPMMGLTHGVHGIGDTIAISVHAAESAVADVDDYFARLAAALG
ncbi:MAG TPA: WS/DGAT domain-containing protein [Mycobacterium sp.]|nr:WS/DGAT domain-containing protein [Mycobacterium sp.]